MSYNGSGTFSINSSGQPVVTGTVISSTAFNALTADLATGLSTAITKDGQTTTTSRILFAQGVSSTLVTDATSATTGSIITAGGISTQKALFVGTTTTLAGALTYGGVTLSNAVTGTGNMVLSASPTFTGTALAAKLRVAGGVGTNSLVIDKSGSAVNRFQFFVGDGTGGTTADENYIANSNTGLHFWGGATGNTEFMTLTNTGLVGIGMTPVRTLDVTGTFGVTGAATFGAGSAVATLTLNGQSGTGAGKGWAILPLVAGVAAGIIGSESYVYGSSDTNLVIQAPTGKSIKLVSFSASGITINSTGTVTMGAYGAGAATFDGSGNITSASDPSQKIIIGDYTDGLAAVVALSNNGFMGWHKWRPESGMETEGTYASFFARDDFPITGAVHKNGERPNSFSDRPVLMAVINAIAELTTRLAALENK